MAWGFRASLGALGRIDIYTLQAWFLAVEVGDMSPSRYELSDLQWEKIEDFLPGRKEHVGRTAADNRLFVDGVLWVLRSGARWADLPERYGKYKSVHKRFVRWANSGVWERVFHELVRDQEEPVSDAGFDHRAGPPAGGHGPQKRGADKALGRSRGGLTTKIHLLTNELGLPLDFLDHGWPGE